MTPDPVPAYPQKFTGGRCKLREVSDDFDAVKRALKLLTAPSQTFEIRTIHPQTYRGLQGFFDDPEVATEYLQRVDTEFQGIYFTLNPLNPDVINRASNKLQKQIQGLGATDGEVIRRAWLPIDIDPVRVKGVSATATEHKHSLLLANQIADTLELVYGFPDPILASSGNGAHLLYGLDLPNDEDCRNTIKAFLAALGHKFSTAALNVDPVNFNASRIWKLYGTVSRKGDNTIERPHRVSKILRLPDFKENVPLDLLKDYAARNCAPKVEKGGKGTSAGLYAQSYPDDELKWKLLNRAALDRVDRWVPSAFGEAARPYHQGYRISSRLLGREREEDIAVHPWPRGIKDFGEHDQDDAKEGRRTPISLLASFVYGDDKEAAAKWLANELGVDESEFTRLASKLSEDEYGEVFKSSQSDARKFDRRTFTNASNLMGMKFKDLSWLVEDMLPEGAFFLSSRPKMRKTWLALQLCIAVATGSTFMGKQVTKGKALLLGLEDNLRRMQRRIDTLHTFIKVPDLSDLIVWTPGGLDFQATFPRGADGCEVIRSFLRENPDCKLVVIDTFAHFRGHETGRQTNVYQLDYESVMPITRLAAEFGITIIIVHHERKGSLKETTDFIEDTSGSTGLTGGVDGIMAIKGKRGSSEENETRQLVLTGRDVPHDYALNIAFDAETGGWRQAQGATIKETLLELLKKYPVLKVTELYATMPNHRQSSIRQALLELRHEGQVENSADGYRIAFSAR